MTNEALQPASREWHGVHHPWAYRPQAFCWDAESIVGINFLPLATEMRQWMQQSGQLTVLTAGHKQLRGACSNPYSYSGSAIALMLSRVINAYHDYATIETPADDPLDTEAECLRLFNEILLYSARFCEVVIKQLLYCTQVPESRYERMSLGALLDSPCPDCKKEQGKKPHTVSWVGTLACPFNLCREFDHCAMDHLFLVNRMRNSFAAHSDGAILHMRGAHESKEQLLHDCTQVLENVVHLLSHLEKLEKRMRLDLAEKGESIMLLKLNGLPPEECNFKLDPGRPFVFERASSEKASDQ